MLCNMRSDRTLTIHYTTREHVTKKKIVWYKQKNTNPITHLEILINQRTNIASTTCISICTSNTIGKENL